LVDWGAGGREPEQAASRAGHRYRYRAEQRARERRGQQKPSHRISPISIVAATTPKMSAIRMPERPRLTARVDGSLSERSLLWVRSFSISLTCVAALALVSCMEATQPARRFPVLADEGESDWTSVSVGGSHTCGIKASGNVYCWGDNEFGQTGVVSGDTVCGGGNNVFACVLTPHLVAQGLHFLSVSAGQGHSCGITVDRDAYCWGLNDQNQVGLAFGSGPALTKVTSALPWTQISAGQSHSCAVRSDGQLFC